MEEAVSVVASGPRRAGQSKRLCGAGRPRCIEASVFVLDIFQLAAHRGNATSTTEFQSRLVVWVGVNADYQYPAYPAACAVATPQEVPGRKGLTRNPAHAARPLARQNELQMALRITRTANKTRSPWESQESTVEWEFRLNRVLPYSRQTLVVRQQPPGAAGELWGSTRLYHRRRIPSDHRG